MSKYWYIIIWLDYDDSSLERLDVIMNDYMLSDQCQ